MKKFPFYSWPTIAAALVALFLLAAGRSEPAHAMFALGSPLHSVQVTAAKRHQAERAVDAGTCYTLADPDTRAYCRAKAHRNATLCYAVQRADLRAQCLAEVRK